MPRSPAEGAATRGPADLDVVPESPLRDRRARTAPDRRATDIGPPNGIERRRYERRSHDRRASPRTDRRASNRRTSISRRGTNPAARPIPRAQARRISEPLPGRSPAAKILRAIVLTAIAVGCLLAATLSGNGKAGASAQLTPAPVLQSVASAQAAPIGSADPAASSESTPPT